MEAPVSGRSGIKTQATLCHSLCLPAAPGCLPASSILSVCRRLRALGGSHLVLTPREIARVSLYFQFFSTWKRQSPVGGSSHRHKHTNTEPREYTITHIHKLPLHKPEAHTYTCIHTCTDTLQWDPLQLLKKNEGDCMF